MLVGMCRCHVPAWSCEVRDDTRRAWKSFCSSAEPPLQGAETMLKCKPKSREVQEHNKDGWDEAEHAQRLLLVSM